MNIAIIDADLIGKGNHRFPNLASMKISSYHKAKGDSVILKTDYNDLNLYDKVYISKVFIDTEIPDENPDKTLKNEKTVSEYYSNHPILNLPNVIYGGTGFYYDKATLLPSEIEHSKPDYDLYNEIVAKLISNGTSVKSLEYYINYSIGYMTRGCIRKCSFCVNKNYSKCLKHSSVYEWLDETKPYICCLDDNVLACKEWKDIFHELQSTGKKFQFKQGCDERLLTDEKCFELFQNSKWLGDHIFAFDNIKDKNIIEEKLKLIRNYTNRQIKFYVFCGYNHNSNDYDEEFWKQDIYELFERIELLMSYGCLPYIMRHKNYVQSPYRGLYINIASWCNQPNIFRKMTFEEFCKARGMSNENYKKYHLDFKSYLDDGNKKGSSWRYYEEFANKYPEIADRFFNIKWNYSNKRK